VFGFTPYYTEAQLRSENAGLVAWIGERVGLSTEILVAKSYAELSQRLQTGDVHVADLSPFGYINAKRENAGLELLAIPISEGSVSYPAHIITHEETGIRTVKELRGKRFAFVDRRSASGYLYPLAYLRNVGYEPDEFFASVHFAGNHEALVDMIEFGRVDAGATFAMQSELAKGKRLHIVATTGRIPLNAFCANAGLPRDLVEKIRSAFLALRSDTDEGRRVLAATPLSGFASVDDRQYDEVRRVARLVDEHIGSAIGPIPPLARPPGKGKLKRH
jgi:phosphate/phosphite/phosphonate ABC transporter binding protein